MILKLVNWPSCVYHSGKWNSNYTSTIMYTYMHSPVNLINSPIITHSSSVQSRSLNVAAMSSYKSQMDLFNYSENNRSKVENRFPVYFMMSTVGGYIKASSNVYLSSKMQGEIGRSATIDTTTANSSPEIFKNPSQCDKSNHNKFQTTSNNPATQHIQWLTPKPTWVNQNRTQLIPNVPWLQISSRN